MPDHNVLTSSDIDAALKNLSDWKVVNNTLHVKYIFSDFISAIRFITEVALECERINHHPKWTNTYNKVEITISTHDADDKITDLDIRLAVYMSQKASELAAKTN